MQELWKQSLIHQTILDYLDRMHYIIQVPSYVDTYCKKKQYIHAAHLLMDALQLIKEHWDLLDVGDMRDHHTTLLELRVTRKV